MVVVKTVIRIIVPPIVIFGVRSAFRNRMARRMPTAGERQL